MKYTLSLLSILLLSITSSYAQIEKEITFETKEIGKTISAQPITGLQAHSKYRIISYNLDTVANDVALVIRKMIDDYFQNKGYLLVYDIRNAKIKWAEQIIGTQFRYIYKGRDIINVLPNKNVGYSRETGKKVWEKTIKPPYAEVMQKDGASAGISSIDMEARVIRWENGKVSENFYDLVYFNDTTIIVSAPEGLSSINTRTGKGWSYRIETYNTNINAAGTVAMSGLGIAMGLVTGVYLVGYTTNIAFHLCSDIQISDNRIYFAGRDYIYCFDDKGYLMWKSPLPVKKTSISYLSVTDTSIMLLNSGVAVNANMVNYGKPFIASFNKQTGEENYLHDIDDITYAPFHYFTQSNVLLVSGNDMWRYNLNTGRIIEHKTLPAGFVMNSFINPSNYYKEEPNGRYISLKELAPTSFYASTANESITRIDEGLNVRETINAQDAWTIDEMKHGLTIIKNKARTKLLRNGALLMDAPCDKVTIVGNKILLSGNNDLIVADRAQFR